MQFIGVTAAVQSCQAVQSQDDLDFENLRKHKSEDETVCVFQVADFIHSLPGCEEQAKQFREEVRVELRRKHDSVSSNTDERNAVISHLLH